MPAPIKRTRQVVNTYPSGTLATTAGGAGTAVVWFSTQIVGVPMDATTGAVMATIFAGVATFVGRSGIKGVFGYVWRGSGETIEHDEE